MVTVIHLSDLHIHRDNLKSDNRNARKLVKHLLDRFRGCAKTKTFIVLTGDLTDDGGLPQYRNLAQAVLRPLGIRFSLLAAPGNHDYAVKGNLFRKVAVGRYAEHVVGHLKIGHWAGADQKYPCVTVQRSEGVVFAGLDSADSSDQAWFAEGYVGQDQCKCLTDVLAEPTYKDYFKVVYLHHHPFDRRFTVKLQGANRLLRAISERVDLVLFGHKHKHEAFFRWRGVPLQLASGKVTEAAGGNGLAYRVLEIEGGRYGRVHTEEIEQAP